MQRRAFLINSTFVALEIAGNHRKSMFKVIGNRIIAPDNKPFVIKGINVQGLNWVWPRSVVKDLDLIKLWGFNCIRVNCLLNPKPGEITYDDNNDLDLIIETFTKEGLVVMLELHDLTGKYFSKTSVPSMDEAIAFYTKLAVNYLNNPYVWFNIQNEPGPVGSKYNYQLTDWYITHAEVINAIRRTGNRNIIICDGAFWGQDAGNWSSNPVKLENSAIITFGQELLNSQPGVYKNVVFSIHVYDQWNYGDAKLDNYVGRVFAKNMCLIFGEYGSHNNVSTKPATQSAMNISKKYGIGKCFWSWFSGDGSKLCTTGNGGGFNIDTLDGTMPTNLTDEGKMIWADNRLAN